MGSSTPDHAALQDCSAQTIDEFHRPRRAGQTDAISAGWPKVGWEWPSVMRDCDTFDEVQQYGQVQKEY
jgi:hypothetical protein